MNTNEWLEKSREQKKPVVQLLQEIGSGWIVVIALASEVSLKEHTSANPYRSTAFLAGRC